MHLSEIVWLVLLITTASVAVTLVVGNALSRRQHKTDEESESIWHRRSGRW